MPVSKDVERHIRAGFTERCLNSAFKLELSCWDMKSGVRKVQVQETLRKLRLTGEIAPEVTGGINFVHCLYQLGVRLAVLVNNHDYDLFKGMEVIEDQAANEITGVHQKVPSNFPRFMMRRESSGGSFRGLNPEQEAIWLGMGRAGDIDLSMKMPDGTSIHPGDEVYSEYETEWDREYREEQERAKRAQEKLRRAENARKRKEEKKLQARNAFYQNAGDYGAF